MTSSSISTTRGDTPNTCSATLLRPSKPARIRLIPLQSSREAATSISSSIRSTLTGSATIRLLLARSVCSAKAILTLRTLLSAMLNTGSSNPNKTNLNQTNLIIVIARGSYIYLYVNKQYAGSVTDNTYTSGQIG